MEPAETVNCAVACVEGCILGEQCPHRENLAATSQFIQNTSLDEMLAIADEAMRRRRMQPPQWVLPDDL